ncbi:MAG TPA: ATP-binding protein [Cellulomonas sp.]
MAGGTITEHIVLVADARSVRTARHWVVRLARSHGIGEQARSTVELLTSELATNAVRHTVGCEAMTVFVRVTDDWFVVAVRDDDPMPPTLSHPPAGAPGGRGVALVDRLASEWGVEDDGPLGKRVWFAVPRAVDRPDDPDGPRRAPAGAVGRTLPVPAHAPLSTAIAP